MSSIETIYDRIVSNIQTALPDYQQMPDAYSIQRNSDLDLVKGFSVGIGPLSPRGPQQGECFQYMLERVFFVTLSNDYNTRTNITGRNDDEISLANDSFAVTKALLLDFTLGGNVSDLQFRDGSGINYLNPETERFIINVSAYTVRYQEILQ